MISALWSTIDSVSGKQGTENPCVGSSILSLATIHPGRLMPVLLQITGI